MEYTQDDHLMISGIQHFKFCRRQWALIHVEQQWAENVHTVVGELMHKKAHDPYLTEKRKDVLIVRALPVSSRIMGVSGECDIVEFHKCEDGIKLFGHRGLYSVYPIEYKKGRPKESDEDKLQLAAQAMCLEEMFQTSISEGAIYYITSHRRYSVPFTEELRNLVKETIHKIELFRRSFSIPPAEKEAKCRACSLREHCRPGMQRSASNYCHELRREAMERDVE